MTRKKLSASKPLQALRTIALRYPDAEEGIACKGTALECGTVKARNKTFLFLGAAEIKLKLGDSLDEAAQHACCAVGAHGWVTVRFTDEHAPPAELLARWLDESYRLLVPKRAKKKK